MKTPSPTAGPKADSGPFSGLRVVDFTHVLAGPACGFYLGLLGADVIKLERVGRGDAIRHRGGTAPDLSARGMSTAYQTQGAGKRSLALDLDHPRGLMAAKRLIGGADVLVENHRPSTLEKLGLRYEDLSADHPRLIHCAMTGYGRGGPKADHPAYDVNIQAASGIMTLTGTTDIGPIRTGAPIMDYATGLAAAFAVSAAVFERERTGKGTFIDVAMLDVAFTLMSSTITDYLTTGNQPKPRGNAANSRSPAAGNFPTADGLISLGVNEEHQFQALCRALDRESWLSDPRFADREARSENREDLSSLLIEALDERAAADWEPILSAAGVPAARVRTLPEALDDPHTRSRASIHSFPKDEDRNREVGIPLLPFTIGGYRASPEVPPPVRGCDGVMILREIGYDEAAIEDMVREGIVEDGRNTD